MSALLQRLQATGPGDSLDWRKIREEIHDEHDRATTTAERVTLLEIFQAVMNQVERSGLSPEDLESFKDARKKDYNLLIVKETRVGENVCTETLYAVTEREVAVGRMAPDHPLRAAAVEAMAAPHLSREELVAIAQGKRAESTSFGARFIAWLKKLIR